MNPWSFLQKLVSYKCVVCVWIICILCLEVSFVEKEMKEFPVIEEHDTIVDAFYKWLEIHHLYILIPERLGSSIDMFNREKGRVAIRKNDTVQVHPLNVYYI